MRTGSTAECCGRYGVAAILGSDMAHPTVNVVVKEVKGIIFEAASYRTTNSSVSKRSYRSHEVNMSSVSWSTRLQHLRPRSITGRVIIVPKR